MSALRRLKLGLVATIVFFAIAAVYTSLTILRQQERLREVSRYNLVWAASQAVTELHRLELRIAAFALPGSPIDRDELQTRFDVMLNRLNILRAGDLGALIGAYPELNSVIDDLEAALAEIDPLLASLAPGDADGVLARLRPFETRLIRLAATANQFSGGQFAEDHRVLLRLHWLFSGLAFTLFACGLAFIGLLFFQNRMLSRAHRELAALAADLRRSSEAAIAGSEAKSRFLANMSHELRTPLNAIVGFSEVLVREPFGAINVPRYREYAADILKSGRHMSELINDILTMARLDAGHFELECESVELSRLTASTIAMMRGTEIAQGRVIAVEGEGGWPTLRADARALRQMLLNLLSNALKFSAPDTIVTVDCARDPAGEVLLTVRDRGIGMTAEQAQLAVQPFHQADNSLARRYEGAGLGLSIVKGLIERHNGRLTITSALGAGTSVTLVFPASAVLVETPRRAA